MWVCVLQVYVSPFRKAVGCHWYVLIRIPTRPLFHSLFQRRRRRRGRFFEWDQHKACLFMGMNPPSARELTHGPGKRRPGTNYTNEWVSEITNNHLKHADVRALGHRELNKSDHRASGWLLHWPWPALIIFLTAMCRRQQCSFMSSPLPPSLCLYIEHKNIFHKKSLRCIRGFEIQLVN